MGATGVSRQTPAPHRFRCLEQRLSQNEAGWRLDAVLAAWLPRALGRPLSKAQIRRLIMVGAIRADGRVLRRPGTPLAAGQQLEARLRLDRLGRAETARLTPGRLGAGAILYEDDALIAIDKPAGLPTHATLDPARPHLVGLVRSYLAERRGLGTPDATDEPYLGVHQRLDRDTSGVLLFSKQRAANPGLAALFAQHEVVKIYHALTHRPPRLPPKEWRVRTQLSRTGERRGARVGVVAFGGVLAETRFRRLEDLPRALLVEAQPITGRTHQIRVQLAQFGAPVLGDEAYGAVRGVAAAPRLMLHAARLQLRHPLSGQALSIESPHPADFRRLLDRLREGA